MTQNDWFWSSK